MNEQVAFPEAFHLQGLTWLVLGRSDIHTGEGTNACPFGGAFVFIIELLYTNKRIFKKGGPFTIVFHSGSIWLRIISETPTVSCNHCLAVGSLYLYGRIVHFISVLSVIMLFKKKLPKDIFLLILERQRDRETSRERHWCERETSIVCLLYVPQLWIEPATYECALNQDQTCTFMCIEQCSKWLSHPARAHPCFLGNIIVSLPAG